MSSLKVCKTCIEEMLIEAQSEGEMFIGFLEDALKRCSDTKWHNPFHELHKDTNFKLCETCIHQLEHEIMTQDLGDENE